MIERLEAGKMQEHKPPCGNGARSASRSTKGEPTKSEPTKGELTKRRIMAATRKVLEENGCQGTRIEDIAAAAGVGKGTLYIYFKDKEALIMEVMKEELVGGGQEMLSSRTLNDPFLSILEPNVSYVRMAFENPGLFRALFEFAIIHPEALQFWSENSAEWLARVEAAMDRRLGRGRTDEGSRILATYAMSWMVDGVLLSNLILGHPRLQKAARSPEHLAEMLSVLWYRAVYGTDPDPERLDSAKPLLDFHLSPDPNGAGNPRIDESGPDASPIR